MQVLLQIRDNIYLTLNTIILFNYSYYLIKGFVGKKLFYALQST